jgi:class 3 adenylate cyclase
MTFQGILAQVITWLQHEQRVSYRALKRQLALDDDYLEALKDELIYAKHLAVDEDGRVLVWTGAPTSVPAPAVPATSEQEHAPLTYTPPHLTDKILAARNALEGERKQVTVLFADLKGSTELIRDLDPEQARTILDPALHAMMAAVHRYGGTVNQVLGDGIMALFGAPLAHEDHTARACYAALAMQGALRRYADEVRRTHSLTVQMRVGLNSLLQERRRTLHARIVEALETLASDRLADQVERLADHAVRGEVWDKALSTVGRPRRRPWSARRPVKP